MAVTIRPRRFIRPLTTDGASGTGVSSAPAVSSCTASTATPDEQIRDATRRIPIIKGH